jgi:hypothetical protein
MFLRQKLLNFASQARVETLQVKYDPASRLECTATLIDDIQYSRKSCHDEYEFRIVPFSRFLVANYINFNLPSKIRQVT